MEIPENVTWKIVTVPDSEKSSPRAPTAPILDDFGLSTKWRPKPSFFYFMGVPLFGPALLM